MLILHQTRESLQGGMTFRAIDITCLGRPL
jgi:hypothetical protein